MEAPSPILAAKDLATGYGSKVILEADDLKLFQGELVAFMGPNGVGKSTLLRTLAGVQPLIDGRIELLGANLKDLSKNQLARAISLVLTERVNPGNLLAHELIALGRYPYTNWTGNLGLIDRQKVEWAIERTRTNYIADRPVLELSDGQLQKIMIARALAQDGDIMILDEPTAHLDLPNQVEIMTLLKSLAETTNKAILVSTHELEITLQTSHRIWLANFGTPIISGVPEDLVLNGSLTKTFYQSGYEWDPGTRQFRIEFSGQHEVGLRGEGTELYWTRQALMRSGYKISDQENVPTVHLIKKTSHSWKIVSQDQEILCDSIEKLLLNLASLLAKTAGQSSSPEI